MPCPMNQYKRFAHIGFLSCLTPSGSSVDEGSATGFCRAQLLLDPTAPRVFARATNGFWQFVFFPYARCWSPGDEVLGGRRVGVEVWFSSPRGPHHWRGHEEILLINT